MPETSSFQWQCFKGCLQHFDQDRARSKGHSIRSYLCLRRQMRTARRWDRLIERSRSSDPKLRTASLEVKATTNVYKVELKFPFRLVRKRHVSEVGRNVNARADKSLTLNSLSA